MADLQASFDALRAKVERAAQAQAQATADAEAAMAAKLDELAAFVDANFAAPPPVDAPPVGDGPLWDTAVIPPVEAEPLPEPVGSHGWRPAQ